MAVGGGRWRQVAAGGGRWRYVAVRGGTWRYVAVRGGTWRCVVVAVGGGVGGWRWWGPEWSGGVVAGQFELSISFISIGFSARQLERMYKSRGLIPPFYIL